jgi:FKBP-type peptidyl-prolyl cis-trans isomerase SlyD
MRIARGSVVSIEYELHFGDGKVIDASEPDAPLSYLHGEGQVVPGLERALEGLSAGDARQVVIAPEEGYGPHDPRGVQTVPRSAFPPGKDPEEGTSMVAQGPGGETVPFIVREVGPDDVTIDLNHPLAGKTLHFAVKVRDVRAATPEELQHGHAHGEGGHEDHED